MNNSVDVTSTIGLEKHNQNPSASQPEPVPVPVPVPAYDHEPEIDWGNLLGLGAVVVGGGIIIGTIIEDFGTYGVGIANDIPTISGGGGMIASGLEKAGQFFSQIGDAFSYYVWRPIFN